MKKVLLFMCILLVISPVIAYGQGIDKTEVCRKAETDAEDEANIALWYGAGCLFGLFGLGAAFLYKPSPPASRLVGKSSEYAATYTDCYTDRAQNLQVMRALTGCSTALALYSLILLL